MGRRGKNKLSRFVALHWEIIDSKAWENLTNASRVALIHLKRKIVKPNPGEISLSYQEMEKIMHRHTFATALKQLEQMGFITKEQRGGLYRRRNWFRLSEEWRKYGQPSSAKNSTVDSAKISTVTSPYRN
ncbi:MAG: hypothetical protein ABSH06_21260 [Thermodesulfobacteriota bacterium]|jgi:DNA-binding MarR family transcriptional regulator